MNNRLSGKHFIQPRGTAVQLKAARQQHAHYAGQHVAGLRQFFKAYIGECEAEMLRAFRFANLPAGGGAAGQQPCHHGRKAQRDARHLGRIHQLLNRRGTLLILRAKFSEIILRVQQQTHRFIKHSCEEYQWRLGCVRLYSHKTNYIKNLCFEPLRFDEK